MYSWRRNQNKMCSPIGEAGAPENGASRRHQEPQGREGAAAGTIGFRRMKEKQSVLLPACIVLLTPTEYMAMVVVSPISTRRAYVASSGRG